MSFLQPIILLGLPLAMIPVIIHLLNRLRYRSVSWGAMMFVLKASRSSTSMARVRQWLILLLRVLAVAVLIVAVGRPLLGGWLGWHFSGTPDSVIILLDRSATMGTSYGDGKSCLKRGVELLMNAGRNSAPDSRILLIDSAVMLPKQVPEWDVLSDLIETEITDTAADIPGLFRKSLDYLLKNGMGVTEIWCLSDMQRSNWNVENEAWGELENKFKSLSQPVTFRVLAVSSNKTGNRSVSFVRIVNYSTPGGNRIHELVFDIQDDAATGESAIPLIVSSSEAKRQINVTLHGEKTRIRHILSVPEKGGFFGYIELPPDANLHDNRFYFAYGEQAKPKTLILTENRLLGEILAAAVAPELKGEDTDVEVIFPAESANRTFDDIALLIWVGSFPRLAMHEKLTDFLENGGTALFFPPDTPRNGDVNRQLNKNTHTWSRIIDFAKTEPQSVVEWFHSDGPLADSVSGQSLPLDSLKIFKLRPLVGGMKTASALCRSGQPFLYQQNIGRKGRLYTCSTLPLANWSNLGEGIILVPMLSRMKLEGAQRFSQILYERCGIWHPADNRTLPESLTGKNGSEKAFEAILNPNYNTGVYSSESKTIVINRPQLEDIRGRIDKTEVKSLFKERPFYMFDESKENNSAIQTEVWRWFLIAMFCFLIAESFLLTPIRGKE